ncbi:MAG: GDP-L-fucose synthase [Verrucomicrobiota bacterium JB022]|nr:GDP-L-fucose synthase [Verrucomicrobiota bacterium JB022]
MNPESRIFVAGHRGMVGSALVRGLQAAGYGHVLTAPRSELDLTDAAAVLDYYRQEKPEVAIIAAAKVGGIEANRSYPAEFLFENLAIAQNTIHGAWKAGVKRVLFLGSSCIYPRKASQPIRESELLKGPLEQTNEAYAIAKIAGLKLCQYYRQQYGVLFHSAMPTNLYGPGDNYHPEHSHVMPALIRRFHEAKETKAPTVTMWGTGRPRREFLHVDDLASACIHLLQLENPPDWVNAGVGEDLSIRELADMVVETVGYEGELVHDYSKPDGTPRKLLDVSLLKSTGWEPKISLREGLKQTYADFLSRKAEGSLRAV